MMPVDAMYLKETDPLPYTMETLNIWPPAPHFPHLGNLRLAQVDAEKTRVVTLEATAREDDTKALSPLELQLALRGYATTHGRIWCAIDHDGYPHFSVAVWVSRH